MILILGFAVADFSLGHKIVPFAVTMMATATVFLIIFIVVNVDVC